MPLQQGDISVQIALATDTLIAADNVVNTWAVQQNGIADPAAVDSAFQAFYLELEDYFASTLSSGTHHTTKMYSLPDPEPRIPFYSSLWGGLGGGSGALPAEVAVCSSFYASHASGEPAARYRGRVYLGPLTTSAGELVGGYSRPSATFRQDVADAMQALTTALSAVDYSLAVWSRTDNELRPVVGGWINDEWDTQRRRGPEVTQRTPWTIII